MSFFDDEPRAERVHQTRQLYANTGPSWQVAPDHYYLPVILPFRTELASSERTAVMLRTAEVWPEAVTFALSVFARDSDLLGHEHPMNPLYDNPDDLRFGVLFADGRHATAHTRYRPPTPAPPDSPVLRTGGGGGNNNHLKRDYFLWPLPPDGPLTLVVRWNARGIPETRTELDGTAIRAAAADVIEIWPDLPPPPPQAQGGSATVTQTQTSAASWSSAFAAPRRADEA